MQFGVKGSELDFQTQNRASLSEIARFSFFLRLWPALLLFTIFLYAVIWSEYPLSSLFSGLSPAIRSPMLDLALRVEGKGAEYNQAAAIILQIALPTLICALGFGYWIRRREQLVES